MLSFARPPPIFEAPKKSNPESDLSARLRSLRNGSSSASPSPAPKPSQGTKVPSFPSLPDEEKDPLRNPIDSDEKTLDELLAELGPEDQWSLNPDEPDDIQKLLNEAKNTLASNEPADSKAHGAKERSIEDSKKPDKEYLTRDIDMAVFAIDDDEETGRKPGTSKLEDESREAQDIVARLLDEVNLDRAKEAEEARDNSSYQGQKEDDEDSGLSLPSAPAALPELPGTGSGEQPSKKSLDFESDIAARMAALKGLGSANSLGLPSAPTFKPADKPIKGAMKKYTDEEVDSWCIICQDDATVKCLGCDGDLYCAGCWKEGHMGPDVGFEERRHKWAKYRKPN
jgi:hypothetical protein